MSSVNSANARNGEAEMYSSCATALPPATRMPIHRLSWLPAKMPPPASSWIVPRHSITQPHVLRSPTSGALRRLHRGGVDGSLGVAEGEGHGSACEALPAADVARHGRPDLDDDVLGAGDGRIRDALGSEGLLDGGVSSGTGDLYRS